MACILNDNSIILDVADVVRPEYFYKQAHRLMFQEMIAVHDEGRPIDEVTLGNKYLLLPEIPSAANWRWYADIIHEKAIARQSIEILNTAINKFYDGEKYETITDEIGKHISKIITNTADDSSMGELLHSLHEDIDKKRDLAITGIPCGLKALDDLTDGFQDGDLVLIAGRPGHGKTSFAVKILCNAAVKDKKPVGIFSLEMSKKQIVARIAAINAGVNLFRLMKGKMLPEEWERYKESTESLRNAPVIIDDAAGITVEYIRAKARRWKQQRNVRLIIIDYIGLMSFPGKASLNDEIGDVTKALKGLAKELQIPVVLLCQLSRDMEKTRE